MIEQAVILTIGRGMRLGSLTKDRSRAMLPVLGKPLVVRVMDRLREAGIKRFVVVVGEHEGGVVSYLNSSWVPDAKVSFVLQTEPRGMAHALSLAASKLDSAFLLASIDHLTPMTQVQQLLKRFDDYRGDMVLSSISTLPDETPRGAVLTTKGSQVTAIADRAIEHREHVAFMLYACGRRILDYIMPRTPITYADPELSAPIQALINDGGQVTFANSEWHLPLTDERDLLAINRRFLREGRDAHILSELPASVHIIPPVRIDPRVSIGLNAKIGPNVYLESGASVGHDAVIWDSVVLRDAVIKPEEVLHNYIISRRERLSEQTIEPPPVTNDAFDFLA
jgi:glucose-1-phosphate thymidylyltransferase